MSHKAIGRVILRTLNERKISVQCGECKLLTTAKWIDARLQEGEWTAVSEVQCVACGLWLYTYCELPPMEGLH